MKLASDDMTVVAVKVLTKPAMLLIYYTYLSEIFFCNFRTKYSHMQSKIFNENIEMIVKNIIPDY